MRLLRRHSASAVRLALTVAAIAIPAEALASAEHARTATPGRPIVGDLGVSIVGSGDKRGEVISARTDVDCESEWGDTSRFSVHILPEIAEGRTRVDFAVSRSTLSGGTIVGTVLDAAGTVHGEATVRGDAAAISDDSNVMNGAYSAALLTVTGVPATGDLTLTITVRDYMSTGFYPTYASVECFVPLAFPLTRVAGSTSLEWKGTSCDGGGYYLSPVTNYLALRSSGGVVVDCQRVGAVSCQNLKTGPGTITMRSSGTLGSATTTVRFKDVCDVLPGWARVPARPAKALGGRMRVIASRRFLVDSTVWLLNRDAKQTFAMTASFGGGVAKKSFSDSATSSGGGGGGGGSTGGGGDSTVKPQGSGGIAVGA